MAAVKTLGIRIVNDARGKHIAMGNNTQVFVVQVDEHGSVTETDISSAVRAVDARIHMKEVVTARLEVFLTGLETRAHVEELVTVKFKPRRLGWWRRKWREVTTFGNKSGALEWLR